MAQIIFNQQLSDSSESIFVADKDEIVIVKLSNYIAVKCIIQKNGVVIDDCMLADSGSPAIKNERQLELNLKAGDVLTAFAGTPNMVNCTIIV